MYTKKVKYTDYNGVEREESFQFNLTKAEVLKMEMSKNGGLAETIRRIIETEDQPAIIAIFEDLVLKAYGVKSVDGKRFIKNDELREEFSQTEAYSDIFMELATDAEKAAEFVNGIVPADMTEEAQKQAKAKANHPALKK